MIVKHWQNDWTVGYLQDYIESKIRDLKAKNEKAHNEKVAGFIGMLEEILKLEYFTDVPRLTMWYFKPRVMEDRDNMKEYLEQQPEKLQKLQKEYDRANQRLKAFSEKHATDDNDEEAFSERMRLETAVNEAYAEIASTEHYIKGSNNAANLLHRLLGIIARADAFFDSVL